MLAHRVCEYFNVSVNTSILQMSQCPLLKHVYAPLLQDADVSQIQVQVCIFAFDLLYLNGEVCKQFCADCMCICEVQCCDVNGRAHTSSL